MTKPKLSWCFKQVKGIKFIEPNNNLSQEYIKEADNTLEAMLINKGKWKVITAYYACYNALYAILMKIGIKSEIHDCSLELMNYIDSFDKEDYLFLNSLKRERIDVQYYLKEKEISSQQEEKVKLFILKCKQILKSLDLDKIKEKIKSEAL